MTIQNELRNKKEHRGYCSDFLTSLKMYIKIKERCSISAVASVGRDRINLSKVSNP